MENKLVEAGKDSQKNESSLQSLCEDIEITDDTILPKTLVKSINPTNVLILNVKESQTSETCILDSRLQPILGINNRIPKHIVSLDEKYLRRCLEMIYLSASKATSVSSSPILGASSKIFISPEIKSTYEFDVAKFIIQCPVGAGAENSVINPLADWFVGRITGSKSLINILKSPIFQQFGALDSEVKFGRTNLIDFTSSLGNLSVSSSREPEKELVIGNRSYGSEPLHRRFVSESSTNSTWSDQTSSSSSTAITKGMLQCTWKAGSPHFVFSVDEQSEVYIANLFKNDSDCSYEFRLGARGKKEIDIHENESYLVGKMRVRTTFTQCPNVSEIMETEFVLFGSNEKFMGEKQSPSRKSKGLSKKVAKVFKTSHSSKKRSPSKFEGKDVLPENSSRDSCEDSCNDLSETQFPPNFELAAIVAKKHICNNRQEEENGGWGLKFLKKVGITKPNASQEASVPSECHLRNSGGSSTSLDILVPAGFHGGPRSIKGGASSIVERWRSNGRCDCGGWDIGCPLTVLNTKPSRKEDVSPADMEEECKSFDICIKGGSEQGPPIMKMVNIHDDLYFVHFQSSLSAIQSFSIAVAIIHTQTPSLRPKLYRSWM